jgi:hypothetical protein
LDYSEYVIRGSKPWDAKIFLEGEEIAKISKGEDLTSKLISKDGHEWILTNNVHSEFRPFSISIRESNNDISDTIAEILTIRIHQEELLGFCKNNKIQLEAYSPLTRGKRLNHPNILELAKKYDKTPAQVLIRWSLQHDIIVIPKSIHEARNKENSQVFDFQLEPNDMKLLNSLNENLYMVFLD